MTVLIARIRVLLPMSGLLLILVGMFTDVGLLVAVGTVMLLIGFACYFVLGTVRRQPVLVQMPVTGRWVALNSPANRVPSHGLHAYGQSYALDLVHDPVRQPRPAFGSGWGFRPPATFPAFGQPVLAPADGVVVRVRDRARDHRSRNSWFGIAYLIVEAFVRELFGPGRVLGNRIVLDLGDGVYAALAHLRQHSARVAVGDVVRTGQYLADCGNSGNSSEPHLHLQLMDHPWLVVAAGLPMEFENFEGADPGRPRVPRNGEPFIAAGNADIPP